MSKAPFSLEISTKPKPKPRVIIYAGPGVGKTTFGRQSEKPVMILTEDGCPHGIPKIPTEGKLETWDDVLGAVGFLLSEEHDRESVVIDTLNGAEELCRQSICDEHFGGRWLPEKGKEGFLQWGQGDKLALTEFKRLLSGLDMLRDQKNMRVILLAHEGLHRCANVFGDDFNKVGGEMNKWTWAASMKWADHVGHATKDVIAVTKQGEKKAVARDIGDTQRWCYFEGSPGRDAKSRASYEMPEKIKFSYEEYTKAQEENCL